MGINVLSLFDGMSCGQIALNKAGIPYSNYFASEVDQKTIEITQFNYPKTIQLGDVTKINSVNLPKIDLLIGGSPCQGFSNSGLLLNFQDPRSKLFFEFVRLLKEVAPRYWLLENVVMKKEYEDIITNYLGVKPVKINSGLVSAQNRERLYWANFDIAQPVDKGINLIDILENSDFPNPAAIRGRGLSKVEQNLEVKSKKRNKSNCLTTVDKDNVLTNLPVGSHKKAFINNLPYRNYTAKEYCRLQTVPENYFGDLVSEWRSKKMLGNGWTIDVIVHILQGIKQNLQ